MLVLRRESFDDFPVSKTGAEERPNERPKLFQIVFYARILLRLRGRVVEEREAKRRELEGVRGGKVNLS